MPEDVPSGRPALVRPGDTLGGKYKVTRVIGSGGMGVVVAARHAQLGKLVAIKVVRAEALLHGPNRARFEREGRVLATLTSEHVAKVHDVGHLATGEPFFVMDLLEGETLGDRVRRLGRLPCEETVAFVLQACEGLAEAHAAGIIHRDLKPDNLFICRHLDETESVKILDFGISKATGATGPTTVTGVVGTPAYMAPEQIDAPGSVDARADVWSLGALMYEALSGHLPFETEAPGLLPVVSAILAFDPPRLEGTEARVPVGLADVVHRCLAKKRDDRYASILDLARALAPHARGDSHAIVQRIERMARNRATPEIAARYTPDDVERPVRPSVVATWTQTVHSPSRRRILAAGLGLAGAGLLGMGGAWLRARQQRANEATLADGAALAALPPLRVGILHSLTGTMAASESPLVDALMLAIAQINASGGLLGRAIEPIVRDGRSHADSFVTEARRLLIEDGVPFVFGCWTSAARRSVRPIFEEHHRLLFYSVQYEGLESSPAILYLGAAPNQQLIPAVRWAFAFLQRRSFFLVGSDYVFPRVAHEILKDQLRLLGAEVAGEAFLPLGASQVGDLAARIRKSGATMILNSINGDSNVALIRALREEGIRSDAIPLLSFSFDQTGYRDLDPSVVAGDYIAWSYFESFDSPANKEFLRLLHDRFGPLRPATDPMATSYAAVRLWAEAVRHARSAEPAAVREALKRVKVTAPFGDLRVDGETGHAVRGVNIGQIDHEGKVQLVWGAPRPVEAVPYPDTRSHEAWEKLLADLYREWGGRWERGGEH
jgi:urea transport system substrate-binding protein